MKLNESFEICNLVVPIVLFLQNIIFCVKVPGLRTFVTVLNFQAYPIVHLSHIDFPHVGGWTILPLIPRLHKLHDGNSSWVIFVEDRTRVNLERLLQTLDAYNHNEVGENKINSIWAIFGYNLLKLQTFCISLTSEFLYPQVCYQEYPLYNTRKHLNFGYLLKDSSDNVY